MNTDIKFTIQLKSYDEFNKPVITIITNIDLFAGEYTAPHLTIPLNGEDYVAFMPGFKEISFFKGGIKDDEISYKTWKVDEDGNIFDVNKINH